MPRRLAAQSFVDGKLPAGGATPHLAAAWESIVRDDVVRRPLDMPGRLLSDYFRRRNRSSLGDSVTTANRLGEMCDTVFVVGHREDLAGCEAITGAAAHPLHNLLPDSQRGGRPRVLFLEPTLDTDLLQGAIDLVRRVGEGLEVHERWAVVIVAPAGDAAQLRDALREGVAAIVQLLCEIASEEAELRERLIVVDESEELAGALLPPNTPFHLLALERAPSLLDGPALFLSALVGADSISQLKGAVWFWEAAKVQLAHESKVVALAAFLARPDCKIAVWHQALEPLCRRLTAGSRVRVVPAYSHAERAELGGLAGDALLHVWSEVVRRDPLNMASFDADEPRLVADALRTSYNAMLPEAELRVRRLNDIALGELCQWFSAAKLLPAIAEQS
jgi:hypothetical protein